jgi:tetratricopeptide (TPR) repeat protein
MTEPTPDPANPAVDAAVTRTSWRPDAAADGPTVTRGVPGDPAAAPPTVDSHADPTDLDTPALGALPAIAGFDVLAEAGRGGMGVVYRARQYALNREVAVKMLATGHAPSAEELIRFRLEAEVAARVRHPNVVPVFESGTHAGRPYLVMEWVAGGTLADALRAERLLPPAAAAALVARLARAVQHAHAHGVVHRDLKPGNVLLAPADGPADPAAVTLRLRGRAVAVVPKVTDFGLAKLTAADAELTETGRVMGTPEFMAPEQARGDGRAVGPAADIHALGAVLYRLVAGRPPFRGEGTYAVLRRVIEDEPESLRAAAPRVPPDLDTVCRKCLRKDPAGRYATAADLAADLEAFLAGRPIAARRVGWAERGWKFARRNPAVAALAAGCAVLLAGGFAGVTWQWRQAEHARGLAEAAGREAVAARRTAEAVNTFLIADMLGAASPERAQGRAVTVGEVLDAAARRADGGLGGEPAVESGVREAIGRSYRTLGRPADAEPHLRRAVEERTSRLGPAHPDTLRAAGELARAVDDAGRWAEAEGLFREAEGTAVAALGPDHPASLDLRAGYALALHAHGRSDDGLGRMAAVAAARERASGPDARETLAAVNDLGVIRFERKEWAEAARLLATAYAGRGRTLGPAHPDTLESGNNLALAYETAGQADKAEELLAEVAGRSARVRGAEHPDTLSAASNLARLQLRRGRPAEAAARFRELHATAAAAAGLGAVHPLTLKLKHNLGAAQAGQRLFADAERTLREVYRVRAEVLPAGHPDTLQAGHDLGVVLAQAGKRSEAFAQLGRVLADRRRVLKDAHPDTLTTAADLAGVGLGLPLTAEQRSDLIRTLTGVWDGARAADGPARESEVTARVAEGLAKHELAADPTDTNRRAAARTYYLAGYAIRKLLTASDPAKRYEVATEAAKFVAFSTGDAAAALPAAADAVAAARKLPADGLQLERAWLFAGQLALQAGRYAEAAPPLRELYAHRKTTAAGGYDRGVAANLLGRAVAGTGPTDEAVALLREGYTLLAANRSPATNEAAHANRVAKAREDLIKCLRTAGRTDEADELTQRK